MSIQWRPYQIACKKAIKEKYDLGINKQLIVSATGTGKRMMAMNLSNHFPRTLFLCHREELINQAYEEAEKLFPLQVGIVKGQRFELDKKVVVASVQTLYNRLDKIHPDTFPLLIIDEAHRYMAPTYLQTVRHFKPKLTTAWTATPKRLDGLSLSNIAQEIVFTYKIQDGIREGYLAPVIAYQIRTNADLSKVRRTAGDFNTADLHVKIDTDERNQLVVEKYLQYGKDRQGVAYCVDIEHAVNIRNMFRKNLINAEVIVSNESICPNRAEIISEFKKGNIQVIANVDILTEGFDYNDIGIIMMTRPTQSESLYVQCIGRGTRLKSEKFRNQFNTQECIILDFVDNTGKHSIVNSYELEKDTPVEQRLFIPPKYREKLLEEKAKRERKMLALYGTDKVVDLLQLPIVKPWNSVKMLEPATDKQLDWMRAMGIWQENTEYTKLQASELISNRPAAPYQIYLLAKWGYDVTNGATIGQFQKVKNARDEKNKFRILS